MAPSHGEETLRTCGVTDYTAFDEGVIYQIGAFILKAVFADHSVPAVGLLLCHKNRKIYLSGDTEYHERLEEFSKEALDVAIICINGRLGNMNVDQAVELTKVLKPTVGIPTHYGMFESNTEDPAKYTSQLHCGVELVYNQVYEVEELIKNV